MTRLSVAIMSLLVFALTVVGCAHLGSGKSEAGWITLFDGKNLDNFNRVGDANWRIEYGIAVADQKTKANGYLVSKNAYRDFQLRVEFWVSHDANSGVFMRCANPAEITDRTCYEANIYDQRPDPSYGTGAIMHLASVSPMPKAGGKWNTYDIMAKGSELTVVLNGAVTVHLQDSKFASGPFALQYGSGIVKFRKVLIRPL